MVAVIDKRLNAGAQTTQYQYDLNGNLDNYTYPNTVKAVHLYDELNRLKSITTTKGTQNPPLASYAYTIGSAGNRTKVVEQSGRAVNYGYDYRFRLKSEAIVGDIAALNGTVNYGYDQVGNRTTRAVASGGGATLVSKLDGFSHTYNAKDQPDGSTFTDNGNTQYEPLSTASIPPASSNPDQYDFENRLVNRASGQVLIFYDGDGNRVRKKVGANTTFYLVDDRNPTGYAQVIEELSARTGDPSAIYTYGHILVSQTRSATKYFYGYDGIYSVRFITDATGNLVTGHSMTYDAYGVLLSPSSPPADNNYLYTGETFDPHLGLYYNRARYYNPNTDRFWTPDGREGSPEEPVTAHRYLYCGGSPINHLDPSGNYEIDVHQFMTWYIARAAGFGEDDARNIGESTQALDAPGSTRDAMYGGLNHKNMDDWHFVSLDRLEELREKILNSTLNPGNVGSYLHALQDTFSHSEGDSYLSVFGDYYQDGGFVNIGHGLNGHGPDWTWMNVPKAMAAAHATYDALVMVRGFTSSGLSGPNQSWSAIEGVIRDFAAPPDPNDIYDQAWFKGLTSVKTLSYEGMNKKIPLASHRRQNLSINRRFPKECKGSRPKHFKNFSSFLAGQPVLSAG